MSDVSNQWLIDWFVSLLLQRYIWRRHNWLVFIVSLLINIQTNNWKLLQPNIWRRHNWLVFIVSLLISIQTNNWIGTAKTNENTSTNQLYRSWQQKHRNPWGINLYQIGDERSTKQSSHKWWESIGNREKKSCIVTRQITCIALITSRIKSCKW